MAATPEQIRATLDRYVATFSSGDGAGWAACFSVDAVHEDPVGTPPNVGRPAIEAFYAASSEAMGGGLSISFKHEPIVIGNEVAVALSATAGVGAARSRVPDIVDVMTFDGDGLISHLRAFWTFESVVPDPA